MSLHNTDLVYEQLEKLIAGHGAVHWQAAVDRIVIRRARRPDGTAVYVTFAYRAGRCYYCSRPTPNLRIAFAEMPDIPTRIHTATHLATPGSSPHTKRGTPPATPIQVQAY